MRGNRVLQFLTNNNIPFIEKSSGLHVSCFNKLEHPNGDTNPSLSVHPEEGYFHCWSCNVSGSFAQLIAAFGHTGSIKEYVGYVPKNLKYDISTLKQNESKISFPGIGVMYLEEKSDRLPAYVTSKKFSGERFKEKIFGEDSLAGRLERIKRIEGEKVALDLNDIAGERFERLLQSDYLESRGLPSLFCQQNEIYKSVKNTKYFYIPMYSITGDLRSLVGVAYDKKNTVPPMYYVTNISNPILGFDTLSDDKDLYVVEGWLDYLKMRLCGYSVVPLLSNAFTAYHYSLCSSVKKNVYFIFDQDKGGYTTMKTILADYISSTTTNWYGIFLDYSRYKDIGDVDLLNIPETIAESTCYKLVTIKKYISLLGAEKFYETFENYKSDGYTFRSESVFTEFAKEYSGAGMQAAT
jgi:hypothetical protein